MSSTDAVTKEEVYAQHYEQFRSMNVILYQLPMVFAAILGGLYYFAFTFLEKNETISVFVLAFCLIFAAASIMIVHRFGLAFNAYINNLNRLDGDYKISLKSSKCPSVLFSIKLLLFVSVLMALAAICLILSDNADFLQTQRV